MWEVEGGAGLRILWDSFSRSMGGVFFSGVGRGFWYKGVWSQGWRLKGGGFRGLEGELGWWFGRRFGLLGVG